MLLFGALLCYPIKYYGGNSHLHLLIYVLAHAETILVKIKYFGYLLVYVPIQNPSRNYEEENQTNEFLSIRAITNI